jgi:hypothetical protein
LQFIIQLSYQGNISYTIIQKFGNNLGQSANVSAKWAYLGLRITYCLYVVSILVMKYNKLCQALISDENKHSFRSETWKSLITFLSFICCVNISDEERVWQCGCGCFSNSFSCWNTCQWFFLFFKNHFWHQHIKTIQKYKPHSILAKKKIKI